MIVSRDERGQMSLMIIGFVVLLGLLLVVVVNASGAYVQHRRLVSAADGAAAAAASGIDRREIYQRGLEAETAPLSSERARQVVREYLRDTGTRFDALSVDVTQRRVRVRLTATFHARLAPPGWPENSSVVAEATAHLRLAEAS